MSRGKGTMRDKGAAMNLTEHNGERRERMRERMNGKAGDLQEKP